MENVICIPYFSRSEKNIITRELRDKQQRYDVIDGMIFYIEFIGWDEPYTSRLLKEYYKKK